MNLHFDPTLNISYGYYRCPECGTAMYAGGPFFHNKGCSRWKPEDSDYHGLDYHIGPEIFRRLLNLRSCPLIPSEITADRLLADFPAICPQFMEDNAP